MESPATLDLEEPNDGDLRLRFLQFTTHPVHLVPTYFFRMLHAKSAEEVGDINLRISSTPHIERYAGHVGFSVREEHRGHHYAARSLILLLPFCKQLGFADLWITCDPQNVASRRTLELAGAQFVDVIDVATDCVIYQSGHVRKCRYRVDLLKNAASE